MGKALLNSVREPPIESIYKLGLVILIYGVKPMYNSPYICHVQYS